MKLKQVEDIVKKELPVVEFQHTLRVRDFALRIAEEEDADKTIVEIAALMHDISKPGRDHPERGGEKCKKLLKGVVDDEIIKKVVECVEHHHPFPPFNTPKPETIEAECVKDADLNDLIHVCTSKYFVHNVVDKGIDKLEDILKACEEGNTKWAEALSTKAGKEIARTMIELNEKFFEELRKRL